MCGREAWTILKSQKFCFQGSMLRISRTAKGLNGAVLQDTETASLIKVNANQVDEK